MPVSQNGWPLQPARSSRRVPGTNVSFTVADGPAGDVLMYVAAQFHLRVERLDEAVDDWGYASRPIAGTTVPSNHASATAIDLNALRHVQHNRGTFTAAQVAEIRKILSEVSYVVNWGGDWNSGSLDEMHFEISGSPSSVAAAAQRISGTSVVPKPTPVTPATISKGDTGPDVKLLQRSLNVVPTTDPGYGTFGPATDSAVRSFQRSNGLDADGVVGPLTWARILSGVNGGSGGSGSAPSSSRPTLSRGSTGPEVAKLQAFLNRVFPSYSRLAVDSAFGAGTEAVVREFQSRSGLVPDGVVGPVTWSALGF